MSVPQYYEICPPDHLLRRGIDIRSSKPDGAVWFMVNPGDGRRADHYEADYYLARPIHMPSIPEGFELAPADRVLVRDEDRILWLGNPQFGWQEVGNSAGAVVSELRLKTIVLQRIATPAPATAPTDIEAELDDLRARHQRLR